MYMHACIWLRACACACTYMCVRVSVRACTCICACVYMYIIMYVMYKMLKLFTTYAQPNTCKHVHKL